MVKKLDFQYIPSIQHPESRIQSFHLCTLKGTLFSTPLRDINASVPFFFNPFCFSLRPVPSSLNKSPGGHILTTFFTTSCQKYTEIAKSIR